MLYWCAVFCVPVVCQLIKMQCFSQNSVKLSFAVSSARAMSYKLSQTQQKCLSKTENQGVGGSIPSLAINQCKELRAATWLPVTLTHMLTHTLILNEAYWKNSC